MGLINVWTLTIVFITLTTAKHFDVEKIKINSLTFEPYFQPTIHRSSIPINSIRLNRHIPDPYTYFEPSAELSLPRGKITPPQHHVRFDGLNVDSTARPFSIRFQNELPNDVKKTRKYPKKVHSNLKTKKSMKISEIDHKTPDFLKSPEPITAESGFNGHGERLEDANDRTQFHMQNHDGEDSYKFGFDTGKGHDRQFRFEERDKHGNVKGHYGYYDKHGDLKVYHYSADPHSGFKVY